MRYISTYTVLVFKHPEQGKNQSYSYK